MQYSAANIWPTKQLTEIAEIRFSGVDKLTNEFEAKVKLCNYVDVFRSHQLDKRINFMIASASAGEIEKFQLRCGDVVFTKDSETPEEIAEPSFVAEDLGLVICGYHLGIARPRHGIDGRYLYYAMKDRTIRQHFVRIANGVTRFGLTLASLDSILIPVPPLNVQQRIAYLLSIWDQAIEGSSNYKSSISSLYKGCSKQFISPNSGRSFRLSQLFEPHRTQAFKPEGPFKALSVRSHGKGTYQRIEKLEALDSGKTVYRVLANRLIVNIVFAWEGAAAITSDLDTDCLVSHRFPMFKLNDNLIDIEYCRHLIRTSTFKQLLGLASPGGAGRNKTLNKTDLLNFELCLPPLEIQKQAGQVLNDLDRQMAAVQLKIEALTRQRDALATELLSGRLRVPVSPDLVPGAN